MILFAIAALTRIHRISGAIGLHIDVQVLDWQNSRLVTIRCLLMSAIAVIAPESTEILGSGTSEWFRWHMMHTPRTKLADTPMTPQAYAVLQ